MPKKIVKSWPAIIEQVKREYTQMNEAGVYRTTLRAMHYRLLEYPELGYPALADPYSSLSKALVEARDNGEIPEEWFEDMKRPSVQKRQSMNPQEYAKAIVNTIDGYVDNYQPPIWYKQNDYYVEIWVEKQTVQTIIEQLVINLVGENQIPVVVCSGYDGRSHLYDHYMRLVEHRRKYGTKHIIICYLGDVDPSGEDMDRDIRERLEKMGLTNFELKRVGVTDEQIQRLQLRKAVDPEILARLRRDPRKDKFMERHNRQLFAVEVDALVKGEGLEELKRIIRKDIMGTYWSQETWNSWYKDSFTPELVKRYLLLEMQNYIEYNNNGNNGG